MPAFDGSPPRRSQPLRPAGKIRVGPVPGVGAVGLFLLILLAAGIAVYCMFALLGDSSPGPAPELYKVPGKSPKMP